MDKKLDMLFKCMAFVSVAINVSPAACIAALLVDVITNDLKK